MDEDSIIMLDQPIECDIVLRQRVLSVAVREYLRTKGQIPPDIKGLSVQFIKSGGEITSRIKFHKEETPDALS